MSDNSNQAPSGTDEDINVSTHPLLNIPFSNSTTLDHGGKNLDHSLHPVQPFSVSNILNSQRCEVMLQGYSNATQRLCFQSPSATNPSHINRDIQYQPGTFTTIGQTRRGSHHGRGGRKVGSGAKTRENYDKLAKSVLFKRLADVMEKHPTNISVTLLDGNASMSSQLFLSKARSYFIVNSSPINRKAIQALPFSVLGVAARFTSSEAVNGATDNPHSSGRHAINTWVDKYGGIRCTCIGSTMYETWDQADKFRDSLCCEHATASKDTFTDFSSAMGLNFSSQLLFRALDAVLLPKQADLDIPCSTLAHDGKTIILVCKDFSTHSGVCWVPIRQMHKNESRTLCSFCDLVDGGNCSHIVQFTRLHMEFVETELASEDECESGFDSGAENGAATNSSSISLKPICPVNCANSVKVDNYIAELAKKGEVFVLKAPSHCIYCSAPRVQSSEASKWNNSGVVMCSIGPCVMHVESNKCSSCTRWYTAEGRDEGVLLDTTCTAGTHAMLREELMGFALANGTILGRLRQFHSRVLSYMDAGVLPTIVPCKSVRKLHSMCRSLCRLIIDGADSTIFSCPTCQGDSYDGMVHKLCIDGIWAGYLKKTSKPFVNYDTLCEPVKTRTSTNRRLNRPRTSLIRIEKTVSLLLQAIRGGKLEITLASISSLVQVIRLLSPSLLPSNFYDHSVCGISAHDIYHDIGEDCALTKLRHLTCTLFDSKTLLYRLLFPLRTYLRRVNRAETPNTLLRGSQYTKTQAASFVHVAIEGPECASGDLRNRNLCWDSATFENLDEDCFKQLWVLYKALIQGPVTHFIRKDDLTSLRNLAEGCMSRNYSWVLHTLLDSQRTDGQTTAEMTAVTNSRILQSGLVAALRVDKEYNKGEMAVKSVIRVVGAVLKVSVDCVTFFYEFYDQNLLVTAKDFQKNWGSSDRDYLLGKFRSLSGGKPESMENMYNTGVMFPVLPQLRPLPFNDEGNTVELAGRNQESLYGYCKKHYLQKNSAFTPGALTFSCACSHPITLGFKVLDKHEGPRAVLDALYQGSRHYRGF